ncbi:GNAT family N-acetyltransferase [Shewanella gaetbuli]|uniref:GNAT family N-acetyltransferase n=1 Tax=Shewanella gaetbuli TaxID=220752 RepID=A0A9X1ZPL7_9GAMM|nr:GNAT family N-acetyltransferase [Shewanella gaetbuli]MCL1141763.1 GNAT family N-acetyltransferase [Shewanella gaetbuli]
MTGLPVKVIEFHPIHAKEISQLFHLAVQAINHPRYNQAKKDAWSAKPRSQKHWQLKYKRHKAWVAQDHAHNIIGFIGLETDFTHQGYINALYVHPNYQHQGVASQLLTSVTQWAKQQQYPQLSVDASYLSKPLFEKHGFKNQRSIIQITKQQSLAAFTLSKTLAAFVQ